jgi:hypothetical protein
MMLFNESQCGFVFADVKGFTGIATWLKIGYFQGCTIELQFVFGRNHLQTDGFGFAGFGTPIQKLQLGIARRDALGVDRTPRIVRDLQKQQFRTTRFQGYLRTQRQNKRLVEACGRRETILRSGNETGHQDCGN